MKITIEEIKDSGKVRILETTLLRELLKMLFKKDWIGIRITIKF